MTRAFTTSLGWSRQQLESWFPADSTVTLCRRLQRFVQRGLLTRTRLGAARGSGQFVYFLSPFGARLLLGSAVMPPRGRSERDLYHSLGISAFYLQLQRALTAHGGELLEWWGQAAAACPLDGRGGSYINPDAAFLLGHDLEQLALLEYDRAPNAASATQFLNKIARYLRYYEHRTYREHLGQGDLQPLLLCLFTDEARLERIQARCRPFLARVGFNRPTMLFGGPAATAAPLAAVWQPLAGGPPLSLLAPS